MNSYEAFTRQFTTRWLSAIDPFSRELIDTGERYLGNPVFVLPVRTADGACVLDVYRYTPLNSQHSVLAFLPEGAIKELVS